MKYFKFLFIFLLIKQITQISSCPQKCICQSNIIINCTNFNSFEELDFSSFETESFDILELRPIYKIILDNKLNLSSIKINKQVILHNIKGFSIETNPFKSIQSNLQAYKNQLELKLFDSDFYFYEYRENYLDTKCDTNNLGLFENTIISKFSKLTFGDNVKYSINTCPLIFNNSNLDLVLAFSMNTTNRLNFKKLKSNNNSTVIININQFYLFNTNLDILDEDLLDFSVFNRLKTLQIFGNLYKIQPNLLSYFTNLKFISFELFNFNQFIQNTEWIYDLNKNLNQTSLLSTLRNNLMIILNDRKQEYTYPNEDFCLFKNFPIKKQVYPVIKTKPDLNCSCTIYWLIQNNKYLINKQQMGLIQSSSIEKCISIDTEQFTERLNECKFEQRLERCGLVNRDLEQDEDGQNDRPFFRLPDLQIPSFDNEFILNKNNTTVRTLAMVIGAVGFLSISAIMGVIYYFFR